MVHRLLTVCIVTLPLVALNASLAEGCSCIYAGPACERFWTTDAVFDGTVLSIEAIPREVHVGRQTFSVNDKLVRLDVRQSWKGVDIGQIEVFTGQGGGDCGFDFAVGERYLVFAYKAPNDGRLHASICSLTEKYEAAADSVLFLESLSKPSRGGRIFGNVELFSSPLNTPTASNKTPMETTVRLSGGGREYSMTSQNGRYEFTGLAPAQYRVDLSLPDGYSADSPSRNVEIPGPRACAEESFALSINGRIAGQLLRPDGRGVDGVRVEIVDADVPRHKQNLSDSYTRDGGFFEFKDLAPGRYIVGLSLRSSPTETSPFARTEYPETIVVTFASTVQLQPWKVPRLTPAKVSGTLVWRDGAPASRIALVALDVTDVTGRKAPRGGIAMTDENGRFSLEVWEGRSYALAVNLPGPGRTPTDVSRLSVTAGMGPVRVRISVDRQQR